jgi:hypothetical protein
MASGFRQRITPSNRATTAELLKSEIKKNLAGLGYVI